jgi:hypothetical protein
MTRQVLSPDNKQATSWALAKPMRRLLRRVTRSLGYDLVRLAPTKVRSRYPLDFTPEDVEIYEAVKAYTMTSPEAVHAVCEAVRHIVRYGVAGVIVECGVWRGGCSMAAALTLLKLGITDRDLYLFDTFEGMPPPTAADVDVLGQSAASRLATADKGNRSVEGWIWAYSSFDETRRAMLSVGYPERRIHLVKGRVEDTLPQHAPPTIALLRLDTDWYESTRHELVHLYPRLSRDGVLIIDDYGHWRGSRKATDEYIADHDLHLFLGRIDYTGRITIKP